MPDSGASKARYARIANLARRIEKMLRKIEVRTDKVDSSRMTVKEKP